MMSKASTDNSQTDATPLILVVVFGTMFLAIVYATVIHLHILLLTCEN